MIVTDIVIVDSGLDMSFVQDTVSGLSFLLVKDKIIHKQDYNDTNGHGTAIYNVIRMHDKDANIYIIKIIDDEEVGATESLLIYALKYILQHIECRIVNLSLSLCSLYNGNELYDVCQKLFDRGTLIVSSFENNGAISFPAAFDNVIGVVSDSSCNHVLDYNYVENSIINIMAKGDLQRVISAKKMPIVREGNSFACAHTTGMLSNIWKKKVHSYISLRNCLKANAKNVFISEEQMPKKREMNMGQNAVLFPFNKEIHSLIRFEHLLPFKILGVYDLKYSAKIGATTNNILKINNTADYIIKNVERIFEDEFDMLILGHVDQYLNFPRQKETIVKFVQECVIRKKYIYSFDNITELIDEGNMSKKSIFYPQVITSKIKRNPLGMLYRIGIPILGIFGTSSQQGKFTLQLILRELLLEDGYNVGQLGSEPTSYLFGMDECYHFGYNSTVNLSGDETVSYINYLLYQISQKKPDIIVVGSQSCTLPWEFGNIDGYAFKQYHFLLGTNPDAVLLCVNEYDPFDIIYRTIQFIESSVECKVIALVVFPQTILVEKDTYNGRVPLSEERYRQFKRKMEKELSRSVYLLGDPIEMRKLYNNVISFFS